MSFPLMPSTEFLSDFMEALRPRLAGDLRTDAMSRALYATDASLYQIQPLGVLLPRHPDDVQVTLEEAARFRIPVLPRGGGSSLAGQTVGAAIVLDFTRHLDALLELNVEERWVCVQPGIVLDHLNATLAPHGLMVGPDPASGNRATLGGMVGNNATGTHSILYGNVINHIRAIRAVLADGSQATFEALNANAWDGKTRLEGAEGALYRGLDRLLREKRAVIERDTPSHWRRNSGYRLEYLLANRDAGTPAQRNMAQLLCGSEGTLAVTTDLTLSLVERPAKTALGVVHFHTRDDALRAVMTVLETEPSAVELFDGVAIAQTRKAPGYAPLLTFLEGDPGSVLITEYYGDTDAELRARLDALDRALKQAGQGYAVVRATAPEEIARVWTVRKAGLGLIMGIKGDHKPVAVIEDASVPVEHLADYIDELERLLKASKMRAAYYAHASAGCLHVRPFINTKDAREVEQMRALSLGSMELVAKYGGSVSSEHGDGIVRGWLNEQFLGKELCGVYRELKALFDPEGLLNPGTLLDTPSMTEHLRLGPTYTTIPVRQELDWTAEGGFAQAVELCNGNGACRKLRHGGMCPSFMATREEEHSTRGRANALRAALSGELPPDTLTSPRMYEVMDLCIQCKACKTECPSNVDMAKIKTEWLHAYWEANGVPRRTRLFAAQPRLARRLNGGWRAGLANGLARRRFTRMLLDRVLGVTKHRALPAFARVPFTTWFEAQRWAGEGPTVVLFADTFNTFFHPETARAAAEFLHHTGHTVVVPDVTACCGRPLISKGLITEAQELALHAVDILYPYAEQGLPIVGLEPSCILTFSDEFLTLLPGDLRAQKVAERTTTFEAYVAQRAEAGAFEETVWKEEAARSVLVHGHCHQKALVGMSDTEQALALPPGYAVKAIEASCCGMAGAFGYEAEHYDLSLAMAERRLAPTVREAAEDTLIVAAGTSCRAQIADTTGRRAYHPAEVLRKALA